MRYLTSPISPASYRSFIPFLILCLLSLSSCAAVYTDASDANKVTFLNSDGASLESLTQKANAYCAQYGKLAAFRKNDTALIAVFDCNWPSTPAR